MKIILLNSQIPFVRGGAEYLVATLRDALVARGHQVEIVCIPFKWWPIENILQNILACRLIQLDSEETDLVISFKFPVYTVPASNKRLWLIHQFRQVYDLWGTNFQELPNTPESLGVRHTVAQLDRHHLAQFSKIFTIAKPPAQRLREYTGIEAAGVLYPPLGDAKLYHAGEYGNYFFYPSRINTIKRQFIAIEAMRYVRSNIKLILAGRPDTQKYGQDLQNYIYKNRLEDRVTLLGWISDEEKAKWLSNAAGIVFIPHNEEYGYVTIEAFHSHKPVITFNDSGGPTDFVVDGHNGLVLAPSAKELAEGMERLWANRHALPQMGERAYQTLADHNINWDYVLENLLS